MKVEIKNSVLVIEAESVEENESLEIWREKYRNSPKEERANKWLECFYFRPVQTVVI